MSGELPCTQTRIAIMTWIVDTYSCNVIRVERGYAMSWSGFLSIFILLKKEIRRFGCSFEWLAISSLYITAKFFPSVLIKYARQVSY